MINVKKRPFLNNAQLARGAYFATLFQGGIQGCEFCRPQIDSVSDVQGLCLFVEVLLWFTAKGVEHSGAKIR
jgi:hypothetical protein